MNRIKLAEKCPMCSSLVDWFEKKDGWMISGKFAFHIMDTHGWPIDFTEQWVNVLIKRLTCLEKN